jgi:hypothetical protein
MNRIRCYTQAFALLTTIAAVAGETPYGKGLTDQNKERFVLDDMEDVSDWYNGSPDETTISVSNESVKQGAAAMVFANLVDHTKGEKNYPVGWPRTGMDMAKLSMTDWSGYDSFECWIRAETSRESLPKTPLGVGFYHSGQKRSSHFPLDQVHKGAWTKITIQVDRLLAPKDVQRVQFNISESDYRHGDRVDFIIDDVVLTRYVEPAVAELTLERRLLFSHDRVVLAQFKLAGYQGLETTRVELGIGRGDSQPLVTASCAARRAGELGLNISDPLGSGDWWVAIFLRDAAGRLIDRREMPVRVIAGPFEEE